MLEGKIRVAPFFKVQSSKITVCPPLALGKNYHDIHQIDLSVDKLEVVSHLTI